MISHWIYLFGATLFISQATSDQVPLVLSPQNITVETRPKKVAIIGAGVAGASAAYHLHDLTRLWIPVDITIYEREQLAGGRVRSAHVYNQPLKDIETGAATFSEDDRCLIRAMDEVGLKKIPSPSFPKKVGVWNGQDFLFVEDEKLQSSTWWDFARSWWRYGLSPWRMQKLISTELDKFRAFAGHPPFSGLVRALTEVGLEAATQSSAKDYLPTQGVASTFLTEIVQPSTRARFTLNLSEMRGLASLVAMDPSQTYSIDGGNWRLLDRMIRISEAHLRLGSRVIKISQAPMGGYRLLLDSKQETGEPESTATADYDVVIITAPFQFNDIELDFTVRPTGVLTPYASRHVTHFTSPNKLSATFFNHSLDTTIPEDILTTIDLDQDASRKFYSITTPQIVSYREPGDCIGESEYLYRVVSAHPMDDSTIARLVGHDDYHDGTALDEYGIRWVDRQVWPHAFPQSSHHRPTALLDEIEIAENLFYTGAGEEVVSSMEMSCRMGDNVARWLFWRKWTPNMDDYFP